MAEEAVWYTCPRCNSRFAIAAEQQSRAVRCPSCLKPIKTSAPTGAGEGRGEQQAKTQSPPAPIAASDDNDYGLVPIPELDEPRKPTIDLDEDVEYTIAPLETRPPNPEPLKVDDFRIEHREQDRWGEPVVARRKREAANPLAETEPLPRPAPLRELPTDILSRDAEREAANRPLPPPRWTFFSGVFTFPWWPQSMFPWVILSVGLILTGGVSLLIVGGYMSGTPIGTVTAGIFGIGWIWLALLTFSYAAACLFAIIEMTAYNFDRRDDWPEPDWRERTVHLLWAVWCAAAAMMIGFGLAEFTRDPVSIARTQVFATAGIITLVFFPIFILSTLETNSMLWIVSGPILRSLAAQFVHWAVFYILSIGMFVGLGWLFVLIGSRGPWMALLTGAPLEAAAIFIYARLIGRLAWRIMRPGELEKQAQRDAQNSIERRDLAAGRR
jgi:hypothetical protein